LLEPFSWKSGTYEISFDASPASSALRVRVPQLIVTGIVKVDTQESADEAVAPAKGKFLSIASALDDVRLTADQQKIVDAARRGVSFDEIRANSGVDPDDVNRITAALLLLGAFKITDRPVPYMPPFKAAAAPPPPPPAAPPPPPAQEEVMSVFLSFRRKDPFDFFGVAEDADISTINQAYLKFADKFSPSKFDPNAPDALHEKAQQIFLAAARGYAELAHNERRDVLVKRRVKAREQAEAAAKAGQAALIDPEQLYKNGCALAEAGKLREALSNFELAAECDAQNGNYAAEATWARFQLKLTPAAVALKRLKDALRIDPNCAVAYLYGGRLHTILGNKMEAEAYLNRAAMLLPKDMRVVEALKGLKK